MTKTTSFLFIIFFVVLTTSCVKDARFAGIKQVDVTGKTDTSLIATAIVKIENPNSYSISARDLKYVFYLNNHNIGWGVADKKTILKAKDTTEVANTLNISLQRVIEQADFVLQNDSIPFECEVSGKFSMFRQHRTEKVKFVLPRAEILQYLLNATMFEQLYRFKNIRIAGVTPKTSKLNIDVEINNIFPMDFTINHINIDIMDKPQNGNKIGNWTSDSTFVVPSDTLTTIPAEMEISNASVATGMLTTIFGGKKPVYLAQGTMQIMVRNQTIVIPVSAKIEL